MSREACNPVAALQTTILRVLNLSTPKNKWLRELVPAIARTEQWASLPSLELASGVKLGQA